MWLSCVYRVKDFSASHLTSEEGWGYKKLGVDTAKIADTNWPKGYSIPCDVMPTA